MIWLSGYCRVTDEPLAVYGLSYQWYSFGGFILVIVVGLISSAIKGFQDPKTLDPDLVFNTGETLFWYLPKNAREFLRFNVGDNHVIIIWIIFLRFRSLIFFFIAPLICKCLMPFYDYTGQEQRRRRTGKIPSNNDFGANRWLNPFIKRRYHRVQITLGSNHLIWNPSVFLFFPLSIPLLLFRFSIIF